MFYVGKIDEVENANFPFNKKSYLDLLLQKERVKERDSESVRFKERA